MKKTLTNYLGLLGIVNLLSYTAAVGFNAVLGIYLYNDFS